ncbi:transglutaminase-like domain-containing protein [Archaeoglobus neptunius]|uniref:transglutaminase-like domain-containing protein n=1 Tax=Archaeoglobus neptunius TaxID=2798580 RepID=UPI001927977E|nr:transglutaminase domain-containing protein [Archaeoglobus neptunius]
MLKKVAGLALLIISISFLSYFLSSLDFSKTGFEGLIGEGNRGSATIEPVSQGYMVFQSADQGEFLGGFENSSGGEGGFADFSNMSSPLNPPNVPIFFVEGLDETTNYLRLYTSSKYESGHWIPDSLQCSQPPIPVFFKKYKITPIVNLSRYLPVSKDTKAVIPLGQDKIFNCYDSDRGVFSTTSTKTSYYGFSTASKITPTSFYGSIEPFPDPEIRSLAEKITANATTDYEKVKAIERFLKTNYKNRYANVDVKDFLFKTRAGTAKQFASAFVLLSQSLGIPSRMVFGYLADPVSTNQTIFASDAYVWAEVRFKEGWIEFDPTPKGSGINTTTEITYVDAKLTAGENFTVMGRVTDENGDPVRGFVEIYFKKDKNSGEGILAGIAVVNGTFNAKLRAPKITGRYNVVAHFTGSKYYLESWSDPEVEVYNRPEFNLSIPDRIPRDFVLKGSLETGGAYTGYIRLCVDGDCREVRVTGGHFETRLKLPEGEHDIKLVFPGQGYLLPAKFEKTVEAGDFEILVDETVREGENITGKVLFNGKPINATLMIDGVSVDAINGNFSVKLPLKLGRNELEFKLADFGYSEQKTVYYKRGVHIDAQKQGEKLVVSVTDSDGNPADGFVELNGVKKKLENGVAVFEIADNFSDGVLIYSGSEKYLPAVKDLSFQFPWYIFVPPLIAAGVAAIYLLYRVLYRGGEIKIYVEKEYPELPNVWDVGETIKIRLEEPALVSVNGFSEFSDRLEVKFDSYGLRKVVAIKKEGRKRKKGEVEIKIMPYSDGIAEIVKKLEDMARKRIDNIESLTGREVMEKLGVRAPVLLNYFEGGKYGNRSYSRKEFLEAFEDYLRVVGHEDF